jgi:hypothetical protein
MTLREALDILELNPNTLDRNILENSLKKHLEGIELRNVMRLMEAYRKANAFINPSLATHGDVRVTMIDEPVPDGPPLNLRPAAKRLTEDNSQRLKRDFASGGTFDESILKAPNSASVPVYDPRAFETQEMMMDEVVPLAGSANVEIVPTERAKAPRQSAARFWSMVVLGGAAAASIGYFGASLVLPPLLGAPNTAVSSQLRPTTNVSTPTATVQPGTPSATIKPNTPSTTGVSQNTTVKPSTPVNTTTPTDLNVNKPTAPKPIVTPTPTQSNTAKLEAERLAKLEATKREAARLAKLQADQAAKLEAERLAKLQAARLAQAKLEANQLAAEQAAANRQAELLAQRRANQLAAQRRANAAAERVAAERVMARREAQRLEAQRLETQRLEAQRQAKRVAAKREAEQAAAKRAAAAKPVVSVRAANQGSFAAWDRAGAVLRYPSWAAIPDSVRALSPAQFRAVVYVASSPATLPGIPR